MSTIELLDEIPEPPSRPRDCALLVSIPTTREEFAGDYRAGTDFVTTYARHTGGTSLDEAWGMYRPYAELAAHVMASVAKRGVAVRRAATLADFHRVVGSCPVTTLVAHWRSARFRPGDIADATKVGGWLQNGGPLPELCAGLNALLDEGSAPASPEVPMGHGGLAARQFRWHERREGIEAELPGCFRGGAAVEFADGFRRIAEITDGMDPAYDGTLDLTVCQSVLLGEMVRRKCPKSLALVSAEPTSMDFRFAAYHQVIEVLARSPRAFEDAVIDVRKALVQRYGKTE